jgi:hypothetical protein
MKILLGDNQFFGVNHFDLEKGQATKLKFDSPIKIESFIKESLSIGMDGFMMNSHQTGYDLLSSSDFDDDKEIHYSIPYAHKYASMVNENGMLSLLSHIYKNTSMIKNISVGFKLLLTQNINSITPLAVNLEVPSQLKKGSYVYVQNIMTDLLIGMGRGDVLIKFIESVVDMGYKPGIITLNPILIDKILSRYHHSEWINDLIVCFNINKEGFNVFPSLKIVETFIESKPNYKLMGMSIFASGAANISSSVDYINSLGLDYVVFGSSKIKNISSNLNLFKL